MVKFTVYLENPERLDKILAQSAELATYTRSQIKNFIEAGKVAVDGKVILKAGSLVKRGEISIILDPPEGTEVVPFEKGLTVLYEDGEVIVVDKPSGLTVHPGAGNKHETLVNALAHHYGFHKPEVFSSGARAGIVHRLDKDTSGVLVVAKTRESHTELVRQFSKRETKREYIALALSTPRRMREIDHELSGTITTQMGRHPVKRKLMTVLESGGRKAITHWQVLERFAYANLLSVRLETGRTHQIRVHLSHLGSPIIGDQTYGNFQALPLALKRAADDFGRQALHAASLQFTHPKTGERLLFHSPVPEDLRRLIAVFQDG